MQISRRGEDTDRIVDLKIEDLFKDVLNIYREKFALAGIELEIAELPDVSVRTKQVLISQVLLNLMNNAFDQITQNESSRNYLRIFFSRSDKKITICLENSGPKISDSVQEKIFQPFFTTKEVGKGTGLGLSICKGIIESLKERIWLDKDASKTTFCFTLPIVESASQAQ